MELVESNMEKFTTAFKFDMAWLANEMKREGLLSEEDCEDVVQLKSVFNDSHKALIMYGSFQKKVKLSCENLEKLNNILKKNKSNLYEEIIAIIDGCKCYTIITNYCIMNVTISCFILSYYVL